ncbi:MAG: J domain-containing protein [Candidatus Methanofastidiosia archaeon]
MMLTITSQKISRIGEGNLEGNSLFAYVFFITLIILYSYWVFFRNQPAFTQERLKIKKLIERNLFRMLETKNIDSEPILDYEFPIYDIEASFENPPEIVRLFESLKLTLKIKNLSEKPIEKLNIEVSSSYGLRIRERNFEISLEPEEIREIEIEMESKYSGNQYLNVKLFSYEVLKYVRFSFQVLRDIGFSKLECLKILGLKENSTKREIKKRRNYLAKKYHPDSNTKLTREEREKAEERMKQINLAYERLKELKVV